ncbi:MAG: Gp37 family protein [Pseudomonadota bacterium]|jgi:hypothetical protein
MSASTRAWLDAAAQTLRERLPEFEVALYPDQPRQWVLKHPRAALLLDYRGSRYSAPLDVGAVAQEREFEIGVSVVARTLNDGFGALALVDAARAALLGQELPHCTQPLRLASERYVSQQDGVWIYELVFACTSLTVQEAAPASLPLLRQVSLASNL